MAETCVRVKRIPSRYPLRGGTHCIVPFSASKISRPQPSPITMPFPPPTPQLPCSSNPISTSPQLLILLPSPLILHPFTRSCVGLSLSLTPHHHPTQPPRKSIRLRRHGRILLPFSFDSRLACAPVLGGDGVHDGLDVRAAAPP